MVGRVIATAGLVASACATNASLACSISSSTDVVIYHGEGPTAECKRWESDFYEWLGLNVATVTATQMKNADCGGKMSDFGVKMVVFPGGNAYNTQKSVQAQGKANVLKFIDNGGLYVGTCAGFYFAASSYWWQDGEQGGGEFQWPNLLGRFPEVEGSIVDIWDDSVSPGYKLTGIDNGLKAIYWGGPTRGWKRTSAGGLPGTVLARYSDVKGDLMAAIHVNDKAHGNLLLFSAHFEAEEGVGIRNTGLTSSMQLANWQYRAQQIQAAAQMEFTIPSALPSRSTDDSVMV
jgi:glutamine amidotransferase-like uncharacterized protein